MSYYDDDEERLLQKIRDFPECVIRSENAFRRIICLNEPDAVRKALFIQPKLIHTKFDDRTCLHMATASCFVDIVKILHEFDSELLDVPNGENQTPLCAATENGDVAMIKLLLSLGSNAIDTPKEDGMTPMNLASWGGELIVPLVLHCFGSEAHFVISDDGLAAVDCDDPIGHLVRRLYFSRSLTEVLFFADETWQQQRLRSKTKMVTPAE